MLSGIATYAMNARRGTPVNNIGRGLAGGITGYAQANDQLRLDKEKQLADQYRQMQMDQMRQTMEDNTRKRADQEAYRAQFKPVGQADFQADNPFGEDLGTLKTATPPTFAGQAIDPKLAAIAPFLDPKEMYSAMIPKQAKYGEVKFSGDGRGYMQGDDGSIKWVNDVTPRDKLVADNLGGKQVYRTEYSADPIAEVQRTATPDSVMTDARARSEGAANRGVTLRGQNMADARSARTQAGKGPMSVTLQKELLESDDALQGSKSVVATLQNALTLNDKAYSGYGAKQRAVVRSNLPGESPEANATIDLDNMMTGQALESLKLVFGGMPTEGERKILLDMQASADKTPAQRKAIMERAISAAQRRGDFAARKAEAIRNGTYLTDGVAEPEQQNVQPQKPAQSFALPPNAKQYEGKTIKDTKTGKRFQAKGGKWVEIK